MEHVPNDLLVEIIRYGRNYVDRWNLLLTSKQFKRAVMTPRLWTHVTLQTSPIFIVRDEEEQRKNPQPKELSISTTGLVQFLRQNFPRDVIELDLSDGMIENESSYNIRKYGNYQGHHATAPFFWKTIYGFPNLAKLSLRNVNSRTYGTIELSVLPSYADQKSNITHLNLINAGLFTMSNKSLESILSACPRLEQIQFESSEDITVDASDFFAKYTPNIKEILCITGPLSATQLSMSCPKLETLILTKPKRSPWQQAEEPVVPPVLRPEITFFNAECKNMWADSKFTKEQAKKLQKAFQNTSHGDFFNTPFIAKLLEVNRDESEGANSLLNFFVKQGIDIDEQVKSKDELRINPFKLQFPYDATFDKELYSEQTYSPLFFYQSEGDSALHLAAKTATSTDFSDITRQHLSLLLKKGANVNLKNKEGKTPICYSLNSGVMNTLIDAGADVTVLDNNGWNVLMNVIANPSRYKREILGNDTMMEMIHLLTEKAIDINYEAPDGMNALKVALLCGQLDTANKIKDMMNKFKRNAPQGVKLSTLSCLCLSRVKEADVYAQKVLVGDLLDGGFDALSQDDKGQNALHIACLYQRFDLARELITYGKDAAELLSAKDRQGYTPLHYAVTSYAKTAAEWSVEAKVVAEITEKLRKYYNFGFDITVQLGDLIAAAAIVEGVNGNVFDVQATNGETLLHTLCRSFQNDKAPIVKQLLTNSTNPDIQDSYGQTPLLISCFNLDVKVVKKLLKHKVNVNAADMHGVTPALALCYGASKGIEELLHFQMNSYRVKGEWELSMQKAKAKIVTDLRDIFALLVKHNADFTAKDKLIWRTPLHILSGCQVDVSDLIEQLVKDHKVDINARDVRNDSALHFAIRKYSLSHLQKLLELGADINAVGHRGFSPLHTLLKLRDYSTFKGNGEMMKGGFKISGHSLVYYHSWIWNSVENGLPLSDSTRYSVKVDLEEKELSNKMILVLFEHADKIDFGIKDFEGELPLHLVCDLWSEEDNLSPILVNSPLVHRLLTPVQRKLPLPNLFLKYAAKEHFMAVGPWGQSALASLVRVFQIAAPPYEMPKDAAIRFLHDILAKGVDLGSFGEPVLRYFTGGNRDVWPEVLEIVFQNVPSSMHEAIFTTDPSRTNSTAMHNCLGNRTETRSTIKETTMILMKYVPKLLNAYDGEGRTPLMDTIRYLSYNNSEEKVTKLAPSIAVLLAQPGIEVNKRNQKTGQTALHMAAYQSSFISLVGLFFNNPYLYNNIGIDQVLPALLNAGADVTIKDNSGKTPLDILPSLEVVAKERRKLLMREEKLSLIDKPVIMIDTNNQQHRALVSAFNLDKLHAFVGQNNVEDNFDLF